jgi:aspartate racemase
MSNTKTIGIIGGLGPGATIDYYKEIINEFSKINPAFDNPEMIIFSVNMSVLMKFLEVKDYNQAAGYLAGCIHKLESAGADFAAITANTPHLFFDEIQEKVNIPLISIVESCAMQAKLMKLKRCGLFGTKFTMNNRFYHDVFNRYDLEVIVPEKDEIKFINQKLFTELELGIFKEETKNELLKIAEEMKIRDHIDSMIMGCTEFPIMFNEENYLGLPFLNTTRIHVKEIVKEYLKRN